MRYILSCSFLLGFLHIAQAREPSTLIQNLEAGTPQTLAFYGTSLTRGHWTTMVEDELKKRYGTLISVHNCAMGGRDSNWGLANIATRVIPVKPDTITIEFSMNDAIQSRDISVERARQNLLEMIVLLKEQNPQVEIILLTMNPQGGEALARPPGQKYHRNLPPYYQMVRDVAKEHDFRLIDLNAAWKAWQAENPEAYSTLVPDGIHPNPLGCREVILPALLSGLGVSTDK